MYDTKTIAELEEMAANLKMQVSLHPDDETDRTELKECERWIEMRRRELEARRDRLAS